MRRKTEIVSGLVGAWLAAVAAPAWAETAAATGAAAPVNAETAPNVAAAGTAAPPDAAAAATAVAGAAADTTTPVSREDGIWLTADGIPTFKVEADGTVDWSTFSGFRRYHAECHVCHGPDGEGSSYAPALKDSAVNMDYYDFLEVVASGRQVVGAASNQVMPAFGTNRNVMCYIEDMYVYLKAHGTGTIPRGRPAKKEAKPDEAAAREADCMEG